MGDFARLCRAAVALAIIDDGAMETPEQPSYLLRFSRDWVQWNLVGGHLGPNDSAVACIARKLVSELRVAPRRVRVVRDPLFALCYDSVSLRTGEPTRYDIEVFAATVRAKSIPVVTHGQTNITLTLGEIRSGKGPGGSLVSEMSIRVADRLVDWADTARAREAVNP